MKQHAYIVDITQHCTFSEHSSERFGDWSEHWENYFGNIRRATTNQFGAVFSPIDFKQGDDVFVLWLEWDSGDSFGWATNQYVDTVAIFDNEKDAYALENLIRKDAKEGFKGTPLKYNSHDGQELSIYTSSWTGYFDRLSNVHVEHTVMGKEK
jgi:hypothetical protein